MLLLNKVSGKEQTNYTTGKFVYFRRVLHGINVLPRARPSYPPFALAYIRSAVKSDLPLNVVE